MNKENFKPDYLKCNKQQKEVHFNICKQIKKDTIMICTIDRKPCIAWEGYKHEGE